MSGTENHSLYRFYDKGGQLLYVGITARIGARFSAHSKSKTWWTDVATSKIEHFPDIESAQQAEDSAIKTEKPAWNSVGVEGSPYHLNGANAATLARRRSCQIARHQRYLREMRTAGLEVHVECIDSEEDYAYNSDPAAFPTR